MKHKTAVITIPCLLLCLVGCGKSIQESSLIGSRQRGPAYGQQPEIRRQIADSAPVKDWRYSISDVKLSDDAQKILVVFAPPTGTNHTETILEHDGFRRYKGTYFSEERRSTVMAAYESADAAWRMKRITSSIQEAENIAKDKTPMPIYPTNAGSVLIVVTIPDR